MRHKPIFLNEIKEYLSKKGIDKVIAGVSGGADSMALLHILRESGIEVTAVHCNFHLRGEESDRDMRFVENYCSLRGIPLIVEHFDVKTHCEENGGSIEMACRDLRYTLFKEIMNREKAGRIAVAHNADDQAETVMLNLMRGSGVAGLRGMKMDTGTVIRPLLNHSRASIEEYLQRHGISFITDSTNLESDYRRNFIRNEVLPLLATRWPDANRSLCRTASIMAEEEKMLEWAERRAGLVEADKLMIEDIRRAPDQKWLLRRFLSSHDMPLSIAEEVLRCIHAVPFQSGKRWLSGKWVLNLERESLEFCDVSKEMEISVNCREMESTPENIRTALSAPLTELCTSLPPESILFRTALPGDKIRPLGMTGSTKVSKIMKDAKLTFSEKRRTVVAVAKDTGELLWVEGLKRSRDFIVNDATGTMYVYTLDIT